MSKKKSLLTVCLCAVAMTMMAQSKRISGTVNDPMGPVMMANITEVDANNRIVSAAQTDFNGNFSMEIKSTKNKLRISFVGDKTKTISLGDKDVYDIMLEADSHTIQEVVVKGTRMGSGGLFIPKREVSVAQQTFDMSSVEGMAFTSADEALQGEIAGLDIVSNSGNLGSGTTMRLRGVTTINGDAQPLIVVDDRIFDNPDETFDFSTATDEQYASLLSVNVEDIASIQVLKDAAATAVWGSKGSNGVIQITTKRGARGKTRVNFSYKFTGTWQPDGYKLLNGDDYTMLMKEEFYNPNQAANATTNIAELNYDQSWSEYENWNNNTDWVKEVKQFGQMHSYNLNLTGGGQKAQFRISAGYDHQTGSIIKQTLDRFSTRLVLDYNVSDRIRFSTNFALTYTNNNQNYSGLLGIAQKLAPNMTVYRQNADGSNTDEYYLMNPVAATGQSPYTGNYSSSQMSKIRDLGNPIAIANLAWKKDQTYRITPNFTLKYELLGIDSNKSRLTFTGRVDFDIYARSVPTYYPAALTTNKWTDKSYNKSTNAESNRFQMSARAEMAFTPYFRNKDWFSTMLVRYEMTTSKSNSQEIKLYSLPDDITAPTAPGALEEMTSGNSRSNSQYLLYNGHLSYKERYILGFSLRADGDSKFGPKNKWAYFPGVSARYNIIDEGFMKPLRDKFLSMMALRASWGVNGKAPSADYLFYSAYKTSGVGNYGNGNTVFPITTIDGLKLDDLRWEKTTSVNLGFNLGFFNDRIEVDFDWYNKNTNDLLMQGVKIPSTTGYASLKYANVGKMNNQGWEFNISGKKILQIGKFSFDASLNVAQNFNEIKEMEQRVLDAINTEWSATTRPESKSKTGYTNRVQVGNALGSIYGFRYKGVYQYGYEYLENYQKEHGLSAEEYEKWINSQLAEGKTFPIVTGSDGKVLMTSQGHPQHIVYNYSDGKSTYTFKGGDAIYEDINNDGQINALDIVYLGNSLPKVQGGFNFTFKYGKWSLKTRFNYRFGNKVVNLARMNLENMFTTYNQCATVNYRWRKDGDVTPIPRAMYNSGYNYQASDRFVENGSYVRFNNLQLAYNFDKKMIKKLGLNQLQLYLSVNNLYCWTKYSGTDPEVSIAGWGVAVDDSQTPRAKSFTVTMNVGF